MKSKKLSQKEYIPSYSPFKEMYANFSNNDPEWAWESIDKVPIDKIKIDRKLLPFNNEVDKNQVIYIINNFYEDAWEAIVVNEDYYLLDGQHRLNVALSLELKYIDVIMKKKKSPEAQKRVWEEIKRKERQEKLDRELGICG